MNSKEWRDYLSEFPGDDFGADDARLAIIADLESSERRAAALEAENREERAQRQMAEAEVARLREAMMKPEQIRGLARFVMKYGDLDKDSHALAPLVLEQIAVATEAALSPQAGEPPEAQGRERMRRLESAARGVMHSHGLDDCDCIQCSRVRGLAPGDQSAALQTGPGAEGPKGGEA